MIRDPIREFSPSRRLVNAATRPGPISIRDSRPLRRLRAMCTQAASMSLRWDTMMKPNKPETRRSNCARRAVRAHGMGLIHRRKPMEKYHVRLHQHCPTDEHSRALTRTTAQDRCRPSSPLTRTRAAAIASRLSRPSRSSSDWRRKRSPSSGAASSTRQEGRRDYTKYLLRFRQIDAAKTHTVGDSVFEMLMKNANDPTCKYNLIVALFAYFASTLCSLISALLMSD